MRIDKWMFITLSSKTTELYTHCIYFYNRSYIMKKYLIKKNSLIFSYKNGPLYNLYNIICFLPVSRPSFTPKLRNKLKQNCA